MYKNIFLVAILITLLSGCELLSSPSAPVYHPSSNYRYEVPRSSSYRNPIYYGDPAQQHRDYGAKRYNPVNLKEVSRRARIEYENSSEMKENYDLLKNNIRTPKVSASDNDSSAKEKMEKATDEELLLKNKNGKSTDKKTDSAVKKEEKGDASLPAAKTE